jgi:F0F1-type ATP synthase beta subunit
VSLAYALDGCRSILDGQCDDLPVKAFYFNGSISEIRKWAAAS